MATLWGNGPPGLGVGDQYLVLTRQGTFNGEDIFTANHSILLWVGGGGAGFSIERSSTTGLMSASVSVVGFFEG
jgi:hypothetical protein